MGKILLAIDTAGSRCSAALFDAARDSILARSEPDIGRGHAERLMDVIADVLRQAGLGYGDLARIAVVVGPGSFTGLRVGVAAARGLSLALGIPATGVCALEALAAPAFGEGSPVLTVTDAKRGEVYAALYGPGGVEWQAPAAIAPADLEVFVAPVISGGALLAVGTGALIAVGSLADRSVEPRNLEGATTIETVARLGARGDGDGLPPRPLYLRGADAKPQSKPAIARLAANME